MISTVFRSRRIVFAHCMIVVSVFLFAAIGSAEENPFSVPTELRRAVEFWKQIFTQFGARDVIFFDPMDPEKIYSVLPVAENEEGRAIIEKERARIIADYELNPEEGRIRTQRGAKELFLSGLKMSGRYLSQMQNIFRSEGLPPDLAYLPLVESSFNVRARSSVGAAGMWQFMPETGRKFLRIDNAVDERLDPLMSTRAAARLLKENYKLLGNWSLAITAYNHGTEGIFNGINAVGSQNLVDLIRRYQSPTFGFASKNFYAEFLAATEVAKNSDAYFPFFRSLRPRSFHEIAINRSLPIQSLLKPAAISSTDFFDWNPAISPTAKFFPVGYRIKVPAEKFDSFMAAQRRLLSAPSGQGKKVSAVAKRSDQPMIEKRSTGKRALVKRKGTNRQTITGLPASRSAAKQA